MSDQLQEVLQKVKAWDLRFSCQDLERQYMQSLVLARGKSTLLGVGFFVAVVASEVEALTIELESGGLSLDRWAHYSSVFAILLIACVAAFVSILLQVQRCQQLTCFKWEVLWLVLSASLSLLLISSSAGAGHGPSVPVSALALAFSTVFFLPVRCGLLWITTLAAAASCSTLALQATPRVKAADAGMVVALLFGSFCCAWRSERHQRKCWELLRNDADGNRHLTTTSTQVSANRLADDSSSEVRVAPAKSRSDANPEPATLGRPFCPICPEAATPVSGPGSKEEISFQGESGARTDESREQATIAIAHLSKDMQVVDAGRCEEAFFGFHIKGCMFMDLIKGEHRQAVTKVAEGNSTDKMMALEVRFRTGFQVAWLRLFRTGLAEPAWLAVLCAESSLKASIVPSKIRQSSTPGDSPFYPSIKSSPVALPANLPGQLDSSDDDMPELLKLPPQAQQQREGQSKVKSTGDASGTNLASNLCFSDDSRKDSSSLSMPACKELEENGDDNHDDGNRPEEEGISSVSPAVMSSGLPLPRIYEILSSADAAASPDLTPGGAPRLGTFSLSLSWDVTPSNSRTPKVETAEIPCQTDLRWNDLGWKCARCARPPKGVTRDDYDRQGGDGRRLDSRRKKRRVPRKPLSSAVMSKLEVFQGVWALKSGPENSAAWLREFVVRGLEVFTTIGVFKLEVEKDETIRFAGGRIEMDDEGCMHRVGKSGAHFVFMRAELRQQQQSEAQPEEPAEPGTQQEDAATIAQENSQDRSEDGSEDDSWDTCSASPSMRSFCSDASS
eukprot:gb/GFBE01072405.1/.p1 GENE.gb/GFBE01072405.1/~~gb/GFBE01072405.1/.p1  ORF type:complete len:788 (+),score=119.96 gb/GFBE01072405.1/:1-2364(+)